MTEQNNNRGNEYDNGYLRKAIYLIIEDTIKRELTEEESKAIKEVLVAWQANVLNKANANYSKIKSLVAQKQPHLLEQLKK